VNSWIDFWDQPNAIYVNQRNLDAHFECLTRDLQHFVPANGKKVVLDFGCGDALGAERLAEGCSTLYLYDAAPAVRKRLRKRLACDRHIIILDDSDLRQLDAGTIDLILVVSVIQYMGKDELASLLRFWHRLLTPMGELIVADVIEPGTPIYLDVASQLKFAWRYGFLLPALAGFARMFFSDYRELRRKAGFTMYRADEMLGLLRGAGFDGVGLPDNIGPGRHRRAYRGRKAPALSVNRPSEQKCP
jgi:cyclopropane fatty-acyl-phospholipid synthase-like methyltransferase